MRLGGIDVRKFHRLPNMNSERGALRDYVSQRIHKPEQRAVRPSASGGNYLTDCIHAGVRPIHKQARGSQVSCDVRDLCNRLGIIRELRVRKHGRRVEHVYRSIHARMDQAGELEVTLGRELDGVGISIGR